MQTKPLFDQKTELENVGEIKYDNKYEKQKEVTCIPNGTC